MDKDDVDIFDLIVQNYDQERFKDLGIVPRVMPSIVKYALELGFDPLEYTRGALLICPAPSGSKRAFMAEAWGWLWNNQQHYLYSVTAVDFNQCSEWFPPSMEDMFELRAAFLTSDDLHITPKVQKPWYRTKERW